MTKKQSGITQLPDVDRIQGVHLQPGATPALTEVALQYSNARTGLCELRIPLLDALYLLNVLERLSQENGYDALRKPPTT